MDARQVREAVTLVNAVVQRIRELRQRRIGSWTTKRLLEELEAVNRGIAVQDDKGFLLAQKTSWFNHDHLLNELGNVQAIMQTLQGVVSDAGVRQEIERSGNSLDKTLRHLEQGQDWVKRFRADVIVHEQLLQQGLSGEKVSASALDSIENRLVRFHDWEDKVVQLGESAVARITQSEQYHYIERQPMSYVRQVAASLVLAIASTVFSAFATPAYAQEAESGPAASVKDEAPVAAKDIEALLKYEKVDQILTEKEIINGATLEFVKYDKEKKTTNYDELVFQKSKKAEERAPVFVFFYLNTDPAEVKFKQTAHRAAIAFKHLATKYGNNIKFVCYDVDTDPEIAKKPMEEKLKHLGLTMTPSVAMHFNLGKTPDNDIYGGGVVEDKFIRGMIGQIRTWIDYNIDNKYPDKPYTARFNNSNKITRVSKP